MPITYTPSTPNNGLDTGANPVWQMVPHNGARTLTVAGHGSLIPRSQDKTIAEVTVTNSGSTTRITIRGKRVGHTPR